MNKSNDQFYELLLTKSSGVNIISNSKYINTLTKGATFAASSFIDIFIYRHLTPCTVYENNRYFTPYITKAYLLFITPRNVFKSSPRPLILALVLCKSSGLTETFRHFSNRFLN